VTSPEFLRDVCNEIQLCGVPDTTWIELACLAVASRFDVHHALSVEFVNANGSHSQSSVGIGAVTSAFPFWDKVFVLDQPPINPFIAKLSPDAIFGLSAYTSRTTVPETKFIISPQFPQLPSSPLIGASLLPKGWESR